MKNFISVKDVKNVDKLVKEALELKKDPFQHKELGRNKTMGLIFLNPSLRTRLSTEKAAKNLGMDVMAMNFSKDGWGLETSSGVIMNGTAGEHIKEAAAVIGQYCDVIGVRSFPKLESKKDDYADTIIKKFIKHSGRPVVSLESATLHPLQSLADAMTIQEYKKKERPKVVLTWAPHIKSLPQAVPNSFAQWMTKSDVDFVITHPEEYELDAKFTGDAKIIYDQNEALKGADFVYAKNWSSVKDYGKTLTQDSSWMISKEKMKQTNDGYFMHCLPVRRNVVVSGGVLDSDRSLVIQQAGNREFAAQAVLKNILGKKK